MTPPIDSPARWSLRIARISGVELRVHALVAAFLALVAVRMTTGPLIGDPAPRAPIILGLEAAAVLVGAILHELGRLLVAGRCSALPLTVSLWPLGGLEDLPPHADWRSRVRAVAGGLGAVLVAGTVVGAVLWAATGTLVGVAIPPPVGDAAPGTLVLRDGTQPPWLVVVFALQHGLLAVMALNLVPMAPLAGGRLLEAVLMRTRGRAAARRIAVQVWLVAACVLLLASTALGAWLGILAAVVGGVGAAAVLVRDEFAPPDADLDLSPSGVGRRARPAEDIPLAGGPRERRGPGDPDDVLEELLRDVGVRLEPPTPGSRPSPVGGGGTVAAGTGGGGPDAGADGDDEPADDRADDAAELARGGASEAEAEAGAPGTGPADPGGSGTPDDVALDLVLEKIARGGLDCLDDGDRAVLARATARRRGG